MNRGEATRRIVEAIEASGRFKVEAIYVRRPPLGSVLPIVEAEVHFRDGDEWIGSQQWALTRGRVTRWYERVYGHARSRSPIEGPPRGPTSAGSEV